MIRRRFLGFFIAIFWGGVMGILSFKSDWLRPIFYKIRYQLLPPPGPKPDSEREEAILPKEGLSISVETAMNSRCTSDYDDNPRHYHWGMFDKTKKLTQAQIEQIKACAKIPRFTDAGIEIESEKNMLTFTIDNRITGSYRDWVMVESGMQQQSIGLVCATIGAGYVFNSFNEEGELISSDKFATVRIKLDAMKPSYDGAYWSFDAPLGTKPWKSGILPDPIRKGTKPLLTALKELKTSNENGRKISTNDIGQLLWAARGRTPHYYRSVPWGMTIPTYQGINYTDLFFISDGNVSRYINWKDDNPSHSLEQVRKGDDSLAKLLASQYKPNNYFIVLSKNENPARSLWEIGYQLFNLLVQAHALNINYHAVLLAENQKVLFKNIGINDAVALVTL